MALVSFSRSPKFEDAPETIPIEMVSMQDFNQIMHGDKTAKQVQPKQRADKIAAVIEAKPKPPIAEAKRDVPTPPPPLKRISDPGQADKVEPPKPPVQAATTPPPAKPAPVPPVADKAAGRRGDPVRPPRAHRRSRRPKKDEAEAAGAQTRPDRQTSRTKESKPAEPGRTNPANRIRRASSTPTI